jgi:acetolactate synthase-1/2/3 large subunit
MPPTIGERLAQVIADGGTRAMFGVPGLQTLSMYGAADDAGLQHVLMRDERAAACAADAYARLSGSVGVCDATVGPGATNIVSGIAEAYAASIPVLAVIADVRGDLVHLRRRAVVSQAVDQAALFQPITKWFGRIDRPETFDAMLDQALRIATTGRPGPVVLELPEDVFTATPSTDGLSRSFGPAAFCYPRQRSAPAPGDIDEAVSLIGAAQRPLLLCGGGVAFSDASAAISALAETHHIPVVTTVSGKGTLDESSPLAGGVTGAFGTALGNSAMAAADLVIAVGCKFGQFTTHYWRLPRADQTVIHIDIDGEEIGRAIAVHLGIVADAREAAIALTQALANSAYEGQNWLGDLTTVEPIPAAPTEGVSPRLLSHLLSDALRDEDVLVCDASLASGWGASGVQRRRARSFIAPRGLAGIGWSGGAAIGARYAVESDRRVVVLAGDGGWGYSLSEVETAARMGLNLTYIVLNNSALGWIRHSEDRLQYRPQSSFAEVDFASVARAMSAHGTRVTNLEQVGDALQVALNDPHPHVLDVVTTRDETPVRRFAPPEAGAYA